MCGATRLCRPHAQCIVNNETSFVNTHVIMMHLLRQFLSRSFFLITHHTSTQTTAVLSRVASGTNITPQGPACQCDGHAHKSLNRDAGASDFIKQLKPQPLEAAKFALSRAEQDLQAHLSHAEHTARAPRQLTHSTSVSTGGHSGDHRMTHPAI